MFYVTGSDTEVALKWKKWRRGFSYVCSGGIGNREPKETEKKMLCLAGLDVQDIFSNLVEPGGPGGVYGKALKMLNEHCTCTPYVAFERHAFRGLSQRQGE